ncbi:three-Cys-motif partner protein TcmP [Haloferax sp. AB510]|uniref:three-Cys-motif partner protein TcmP n=1 Tax=Haloferax sp. AB510 TaxID=2934172 RepID=UPI00209BF61A|nr:three-Cys-motif partner protein TcmP [Haloferax sp. AB510]MCO8266707.1 three-Cys-motif partner protein TcmP [Haloferax sp. AB510]
MLDDDDENKFEMKGQTEMKHRILKAYLKPWLRKISQVDSTLLFVDGFAGPGRYTDDSEGSPLLAMDMADAIVKSLDRIEEVKCVFVELEPENHAQLSQEVDAKRKKVDDRISATCKETGFESWANEFIQEHTSKTPPPGLIFIDPFGYSGIPFDTISELYQLRDGAWEVLITFMAGKMAQWMEDQNHKQAITKTLGTPDWESEIRPSLSKDERAEKFSSFYQRQLRTKAGARYTMPFEMKEESKRQICYYLIHATNKLDGLVVMKETMYNAGADDKFAYLGPDHSGYDDSQMSFTQFGGTDNFDQQVEDFANSLHDRYKNEEMSFRDLLEVTFDKNIFKLTHYRSAFDILSERGELDVVHRPHLKDGNKSSGYGLDDLLQFQKQSSLADYGF